MRKLIFISLLSFFTQAQHEQHGLFCQMDNQAPDAAHLCQRAIQSQDHPIKLLGNKGKFYVFWGYHRGFHPKADGTDRPSTNLSSYLDIINFSIPQYNFRVGYFISDRWSIEFGTDHMKWVFDSSLHYKIEGDFNKDVWINGERITFETAIRVGLGFGIHSDLGLTIGYGSFFLQGSLRNVLGKMNNAPFISNYGSISQTPTLSTQLIFGGGAKFNFLNGDRKKREHLQQERAS